MATTQKIRAALEALDHENDDLWTTDGLPRIDAVEAILGEDTNRPAVLDAAPNFFRNNPDIPSDDGDEDADEDADADEDVDADTNGAEASRDTTVTAEALAADEAWKDTIREELAGVREELTRVENEIRVANARRTELIGMVDDLQVKHDAAFPPVSPVAAIKAHLASEQRQRAMRAGMLKRMEEFASKTGG